MGMVPQQAVVLAECILSRENGAGYWMPFDEQMDERDAADCLPLSVGDLCYSFDDESMALVQSICFRVVDGTPYVIDTTPVRESQRGVPAASGIFFRTPQEAAACYSDCIQWAVDETREKLAALEAASSLHTETED